MAPAQGPLLIVQRYTLLPMPMPLTVVVGLFALAKVPVPLTTVQVPVAGAVAALAASVTEATGAQRSWSGPAFAAGAAALKMRNVTSSDVVCGVQGPLLIVQRNTTVPVVRLVTVVVGLVGVVRVAVPDTTVHRPVAGNTAAFAAITVVVLAPSRHRS